MGSIPGSGRSPGGGKGNHSSILAWEIPWAEKAGGLQSIGSQRIRHNCTYKKGKKDWIHFFYYYFMWLKKKKT